MNIYQVNNRRPEIDLKSTLKTILEEKTVEELEKFVDKHRAEIKDFDLFNQPCDKKLGVPLHFACRDDDNVDRVRILVEHGADLEKADLGGRSVLHIACTRNCINIVKYCIDRGMEVDFKNTVGGSTPLVIAVMNGHFEITKYLLENGADFLFEYNKMSLQEVADSQASDEVSNLVNDYITKDKNWRRRKNLLLLYTKKTPLAKLRMYLFRKVALYA